MTTARRSARLALPLLVALAACGEQAPGLPGDPGTPDAGTPVDPSVPPEIDARLVINEVMADNAATAVDADGLAGDWIEIFNPTDTDVPLHGYHVTDALATPGKATIGAGVVAPAGGHVVLWLDGAPDRGPDHLDLKLAAAGGEVGLSRPDGSYLDRLSYDAQATDLAAAREPDGSDRWVIEWHASPGAANPAGDGAPVAVEDVGAPPEAVPAAGDLSERILGYDVLLELGVELEPAAVAALQADPFTYVPGHLVYDGRRYGPVGVRLKGQNSFLPIGEKPSLRINIDEFVMGAKFFGLDDLTLNNMSLDSSMMHERLAYLVAREAGIPASRANHAVLTINGQAYGLYVNVETVKWHMLARWFADPSGPLYEATDVDFVASLIAGYEHESGADDRSMLSGLATALTIADPDEALAAAAAYVDLGQFQRFWALCAVIGQFDSFPYSLPGDDYFVYADPASGLLHFMPWGMDETFFAPDYDVTQVSSVLARRCSESPACFDAFVDEVWALVDLVESLDLLGEQAAVAAQIAPHVAADSRRPYTLAAVQQFQDGVRYFLLNRATHLSDWLPPPSP